MNQQARAILNENILGVLATINEDGSPRATPLHFAADDEALYWFSAADRDHSINLTRENRASVAIFSPDTSGGLRGVYISGAAERLDDDKHGDVYDLFLQRLSFVPPSFKEWTAYKLLIGTLDEQKSTGNCWYFYT